MKPFFLSALSLCAGLLLSTCADPPTFSDVPSIEFDNIVFKDVADASAVDSLIVTVRFKDGDGNMGLDPTETAYPYHEKYYFTLPSGNPYPFSLPPTGNFVNYKTRRGLLIDSNTSNDTLPGFIKPYFCTAWDVKTLNSKTDTVYFHLNPNHYNIFVEYYIKNSDGTYTLFDWQKEFASYPSCGETFNGRFPVLSKDLSQRTPLDGSIRYAMKSTGFLILFSIKTLKLKITIQDRALNKSNTVETPDFTLQGIKK